jgi:hypothetical protein
MVHGVGHMSGRSRLPSRVFQCRHWFRARSIRWTGQPGNSYRWPALGWRYRPFQPKRDVSGYRQKGRQVLCTCRPRQLSNYRTRSGAIRRSLLLHRQRESQAGPSCPHGGELRIPLGVGDPLRRPRDAALRPRLPEFLHLASTATTPLISHWLSYASDSRIPILNCEELPNATGASYRPGSSELSSAVDPPMSTRPSISK